MKKSILSASLLLAIACLTACSDEEVKDSDVITEESTDATSSELANQTKDKEPEETATTEKPREKSEPAILTVENNEELAALLALKDEHDSSVAEFAQKYKGQTIQFIAHIASIAPHGSTKTRYDFLIYVGDYNGTTFSGPVFRFEDVNTFDLHLTNDEIPDSIKEQQNILVTAEVERYDDRSGLFLLKPIETELREPIK